MDGSGSGQREIQSPPVSTPCRSTGCVFYAHNMFDGMCSKCFKDLQEQMQTSSSHTPSPSATVTSNNNSSSANSTNQLTPVSEIASSPKSAAESANAAVASLPVISGKDSNTATPSVSDAKSELNSTCTSSPKDKSKKKRCVTCKKRVGLTGFDCRCGGHYCSVHRYSDMHACSFDYHELAQMEIRKQNPVVAAEKIKKI